MAPDVQPRLSPTRCSGDRASSFDEFLRQAHIADARGASELADELRDEYGYRLLKAAADARTDATGWEAACIPIKAHGGGLVSVVDPSRDDFRRFVKAYRDHAGLTPGAPRSPAKLARLRAHSQGLFLAVEMLPEAVRVAMARTGAKEAQREALDRGDLEAASRLDRELADLEVVCSASRQALHGRRPHGARRSSSRRAVARRSASRGSPGRPRRSADDPELASIRRAA
jgi:hypothetical protein